MTPDPVGGQMRILVASDKFKGTLSAAQACRAIAAGWTSVRTRDAVEHCPLSDGGDGFGSVMADLLGAGKRSVRTVDAAHRSIVAGWWWRPGEKLAVIEAAEVVGLARLPAGKFDPFQLDTFGLGKALTAAVKSGARCVIGIGGSATNDGGFGLACALGWQFLDRHGRKLEQWWELARLKRVIPASSFPLEITVAVDVLNPLLGARGCSRVYGPQKGLRELTFAEGCLRRLAKVVNDELAHDYARVPGAGAAGGLGFGLMAFAGATVRSGFQIFAEAARLEDRMRLADLVITGEGALDRQSLMGKGAGELGKLCRRLSVPCIALAGLVADPAAVRKTFTLTAALTDVATLEQAKANPRVWLAELAAKVARQW